MKTTNLSTLTIHTLTQEQYERIIAAGNVDENALYLTPEEDLDAKYATIDFVIEEIAKAQLEGEDIDLSGYATKDDLLTYATKNNVTTQISNAINTIDFPVDSVNGKTGTVQLSAADVNAVSISRTINGKTLSSNIVLSAEDVGADASGAAATALTSAKSYTDTKVAGIVDSAPETLNTLNELAAALGDNPNFATSIATQIGNKANSSDFIAHTDNKSNPHAVTAVQTGALPLTGGTLTGALYLTPDIHYGTVFPSDATAGRIFFKKV